MVSSSSESTKSAFSKSKSDSDSEGEASEHTLRVSIPIWSEQGGRQGN